MVPAASLSVDLRVWGGGFVWALRVSGLAFGRSCRLAKTCQGRFFHDSAKEHCRC